MRIPGSRFAVVFTVLSSLCFNAAAQTTNNVANSDTLTRSLPDTASSLIRVLGALVFVLALFLGGVWLYRNWQRLALRRGGVPKLNVLEVRSLGGRHALYVVAYEHERFLLAASPAGVNLVSHLQPGDATPGGTDTPPQPSFAQTLKQKSQ